MKLCNIKNTFKGLPGSVKLFVYVERKLFVNKFKQVGVELRIWFNSLRSKIPSKIKKLKLLEYENLYISEGLFKDK